MRRHWRPNMPALVPPPRMRQRSGSSRSFLRGPDALAGGSTWTTPALQRSYRARETARGNKIRISKVSTVTGEPRLANARGAAFVYDLALLDGAAGLAVVRAAGEWRAPGVGRSVLSTATHAGITSGSARQHAAA